jgi:hypothetical protein
MRIPILIVIPLCLITVALVHWLGAKDKDFVTPPSDKVLEAVRAEALASLPAIHSEEEAVTPLVAAEIIETHANDALDPSAENTVPVLDAFSERAADGADSLLALAEAFEKKNLLDLALLANERVLDLAVSSADEIQTALSSTARLRQQLPAWKNQGEPIFRVVIHIGTSSVFAKDLPSILDSLVADLAKSSSGIIEFSYKLNIGKGIQTIDSPTPIAIWITGSEADSPSTDVLSFTTDQPETLTKELSKTMFQLIRNKVSEHSSYNPAPEPADDIHFALNYHLTRLLWSEFGKTLNLAP